MRRRGSLWEQRAAVSEVRGRRSFRAYNHYKSPVAILAQALFPFFRNFGAKNWGSRKGAAPGSRKGAACYPPLFIYLGRGGLPGDRWGAAPPLKIDPPPGADKTYFWHFLAL